MALSPLPASNTERWFLDYDVMDTHHVLIMRSADVITADEAAEAFDALLDALAPDLMPVIPTGLRHASAGSDVTFPEALAGLSASYGVNTEVPINIPLQATFTGRSGDGRKARVGFFGWQAANDASWRYKTSESSTVAAVIPVLNGLSGSGRFVSISGEGVTYHPYMNVGFNDHWVHKRRVG